MSERAKHLTRSFLHELMGKRDDEVQQLAVIMVCSEKKEKQKEKWLGRQGQLEFSTLQRELGVRFSFCEH